MEDWQLDEWHNRMEQDYYDDLEANYYTANVDDETKIVLVNGKSLYVHFNADIIDDEQHEWQIDWNTVEADDDCAKEIFNGKHNGISFLSKDEEEELYLNLENYLYEMDRKKEIKWSL